MLKGKIQFEERDVSLDTGRGTLFKRFYFRKEKW